MFCTNESNMIDYNPMYKWFLLSQKSTTATIYWDCLAGCQPVCQYAKKWGIVKSILFFVCFSHLVWISDYQWKSDYVDHLGQNWLVCCLSDDKDAVVRELKTCSQLIKDALEEIEEVGTGSVVGTQLFNIIYNGYFIQGSNYFLTPTRGIINISVR